MVSKRPRSLPAVSLGFLQITRLGSGFRLTRKLLTSSTQETNDNQADIWSVSMLTSLWDRVTDWGSQLDLTSPGDLSNMRDLYGRWVYDIKRLMSHILNSKVSCDTHKAQSVLYAAFQPQKAINCQATSIRKQLLTQTT